jgi:hypothetical protein
VGVKLENSACNVSEEGTLLLCDTRLKFEAIADGNSAVILDGEFEGILDDSKGADTSTGPFDRTVNGDLNGISNWFYVDKGVLVVALVCFDGEPNCHCVGNSKRNLNEGSPDTVGKGFIYLIEGGFDVIREGAEDKLVEGVSENSLEGLCDKIVDGIFESIGCKCSDILPLSQNSRTLVFWTPVISFIFFGIFA